MTKPDLDLRRKVMAELPDTEAMAIPARIIAERLGIHPAIVGTVLRSLVASNHVHSRIRRDPRPSRRSKKGRLTWVHEKKKYYWKIKETEDVIKP